MVNPYDLTDSRQLALIQGYVVDVKDKGDVKNTDSLQRAYELGKSIE